MSNLIFFILVVPILIFVLYLGGSAVMAGVKAKEENRTTKKEVNDQSEELSDNLDVDPNLSSELIKLNELLKSGVLTQEEFDKAKKKILDN